jgi:hypothetical protein
VPPTRVAHQCIAGLSVAEHKLGCLDPGHPAKSSAHKTDLLGSLVTPGIDPTSDLQIHGLKPLWSKGLGGKTVAIPIQMDLSEFSEFSALSAVNSSLAKSWEAAGSNGDKLK